MLSAFLKLSYALHDFSPTFATLHALLNENSYVQRCLNLHPLIETIVNMLLFTEPIIGLHFDLRVS